MRIISADTVTKETPGRVWFFTIKNSLKYLLLICKYSILLVLLFFLAGHERANPKIGNTTIEFFSSDFRLGILLNIKNTAVNSYDENLEKKLIYWFYSERQFQPAWTLNYETNSSFDDIISLIENAENFGLFSSVYNTHDLNLYLNLMHNSSDDEERLNARVRLERATTLAAFQFMIHLATGIGDYDTSAAYLTFINSLPPHLNQQIEQKNIRTGVLDVQPKSFEYVKLQRALEKYMTLASEDTIKYNIDLLKNNDSLVLHRLVSQGYLAKNFSNDSNIVSKAIKSFQRFHCLEETGSVDKETIEALSHGTKDKFYQISLNLNRLRKDELKNRNSILVNIPEFRLHYYDHQGRSTNFNVVVGKKHTPTPVLTSKINRIVANPYWTVPKSITYNEIIPRLRKDSTYLQRNGFAIIDNYENTVNASTIDWDAIKTGEFDYWIRQKNSRSNALGVIKFLFPNKYRVYLHDTQSKKLFERNIRAYSHGCVRVQNPQDLAQLIISSNKKAEEKLDIHEIISTRERHDIRLDEPISIYIRYYTCTADKDGNIYFHPDVYSRDKKELEEFIKYTNRV